MTSSLEPRTPVHRSAAPGREGGSNIPLWLKLGWSLWVAIWIPYYWNYYGPQNFLWFCDISNLMIAAALWAESPLLFSWQAVSVLVVQSVMTLDVLARLTGTWHPPGITQYMFDVDYPLHIRLLSCYHFAIPPLLIWALWKLRYDKRALPAQCLSALVLLPITWLFGRGDPSDPRLDRNLNYTWAPFDIPQTVMAPWLYLVVCMIAYPLLIYVPTHFLLARLFRNRDP